MLVHIVYIESDHLENMLDVYFSKKQYGMQSSMLLADCNISHNAASLSNYLILVKSCICCHCLSSVIALPFFGNVGMVKSGTGYVAS